jgi:hypothetical protein
MKRVFSLKRPFKARITANPSEKAADARGPLKADYRSVPGRTLSINHQGDKK